MVCYLEFYSFVIVCWAGNTVVQEDFTYAPWNQQRSIVGSNTAHGHSAFASWNNNSQSTQNGGLHVVARRSSTISSAPFYRAVNSACASQLRAGGSVPPQPPFSVSWRVHYWISSDFNINFTMGSSQFYQVSCYCKNIYLEKHWVYQLWYEGLYFYFYFHSKMVGGGGNMKFGVLMMFSMSADGGSICLKLPCYLSWTIHSITS